MLEYAANACAHWKVERLQTLFERRCVTSRLNPREELNTLLSGPDADADLVWQKVAQNIAQERLRLVFIADRFAPETQRIIEFLNRQMQLTEVYAVEVRQFTGGGMKTLVPRILNPSVLQTDRRAATTQRGEIWTSDRFYADVQVRLGNDAVTLIQVDS